MYKDKKIIATILARGGSKGLPNKNIKPMLDKPLLGYTIEQAKDSELLDEIVLSTDDQNIAKVANRFGLKTPFMRPAELARDDSPSADAVIHALDWYKEKGREFDVLVLLEPTSPLRKKTDIDDAIKLFIDHYEKADSLLCLGEIHSDTEHPIGAKAVEDGYIKAFIKDGMSFYQRQQLPKAYGIYGGIYIAKIDVYRQTKAFLGERTIPYFVERWQEFEIDDYIDWVCVEAVMKDKEKVV
jgi:CMP-N-acetylneuraminic acid synthetase